MSTACKFSLITQLKQNKDFAELIPDFWPVDPHRKAPLPSDFRYDNTYILRSSLRGEGDQKLFSGKSISIPEIQDRRTFLRALEVIRKQPKLTQVLLQKQVRPSLHLTGCWVDGLLYLETTHKAKSPGSAYLTSSTYVGEIPGQRRIFKILQKIHKQLDLKNTLFEWALTSREDLYLLQIQEVHQDQVCQIFNSTALNSVLKHQRKTKRPFHWKQILRLQFKAYRLRQKLQKNKLKQNDLPTLFENWIFIGFLFHLFQHFHRFHTASEFSDFLFYVSQGRNWLQKLTLKHIAIANALRTDLFPNSGFHGLKEQKPLFFSGDHVVQGRPGKEILFLPTLDPHQIYRLSRKNPSPAIVTQETRWLSHGILAAIETRIPTLAGVSDPDWSTLIQSSHLELDFQNQCWKTYN